MDIDPDYNAYEILFRPPIRDRQNPFENFTDNQFIERFRLSKETALELGDFLTNLHERPTQRNHSLPVAIQLCVTLRFYATGSFQLAIGDLAGVAQPTASVIIKSISRSICDLRRDFIKFPVDEEKRQLSIRFQNIARIPHIIGAIDCTHIRILRPREFAGNYINRKGYYSLNIQAVCDTNCSFLNIVARWPGATHDSRIFSNSTLHTKLDNGDLQGILLGDNGYPSLPFLLTPIRRPLNEAEENYNRHQIRARNVIERAFGLLKRRFACLGPDSRLRLRLETTMSVIVACAVLHNLCISRNINLPEMELPVNFVNFNQGVGERRLAGNVFRRRIINQYFNN